MTRTSEEMDLRTECTNTIHNIILNIYSKHTDKCGSHLLSKKLLYSKDVDHYKKKKNTTFQNEKNVIMRCSALMHTSTTQFMQPRHSDY